MDGVLIGVLEVGFDGVLIGVAEGWCLLRSISILFFDMPI